MKTFTRDILLSVLIGIIMPMLVLGMIVGLDESDHSDPIGSSCDSDKASAAQITLPTQMTVKLLAEDGTLTDIELETYLCGVVLAEMPADFEMEALKAQSVVARTYVLRWLEKGIKHDRGTICADPSCCQGYISNDQYLSMGGSQSDVTKIGSAVYATAGDVVTYNGELIDATYFSCSGGRTEDAVAVWGNDVPYLQATDSPGEENSAYYTDTVSFTPEEIEQALSVTLEGEPDNWFIVRSYTDGDSVECIDVCGTVFSGVAMRKLLSLQSTAFTVSATEDCVTFSTKGYGHRVGMSQYGADAMAKNGSTYDEILAHYYKGTRVTQYQQDD